MLMEWTIPIQKVEVSKIQVGVLQKLAKPLSPLSYADGPIVFQNLNLLLPPLTVKDYDTQTGKLVLSLVESTPTAAKLSAVQGSLLNSVFMNQRQWFPESNRTKEQIQSLFQSFVENTHLYLYCPIQTQEKRNSIHIWKDNTWNKLTGPGFLQKGDSIRVALRLQGISFQMNASTGVWTGRFRVQHKISCIYVCPPKFIQKVVEEQKHSQP
jgi:hypothetical protein